MAPARALTAEIEQRCRAQVAATAPELELVFHPQCFRQHGHFAGDDRERANAFLDLANDPAIDAIWFGRGGYGSGRLLDRVLEGLTAEAEAKTYLGYSDVGALLGTLYGRGIACIAHGPMPADILREGGAAAIDRAARFLADGVAVRAADGAPAAAFNLSTLSSLAGTRFLPDLTGHVLHLEDVGEYAYRIDRCFFTLASTPWFTRLAGVRLGRFSQIPENDIDFAMSAREIAAHWCARTGVAFLGDSPIGHDADNEIIAFGATGGDPA